MLTLVEAGERIGLSPHTLRRAAEARTLSAVKMGKTWLVTVEEVERYERENKGKPGRKAKTTTTTTTETTTTAAPRATRKADDIA